MRVVFNFPLADNIDLLRTAFGPRAQSEGMDWNFRSRSQKNRVLLLASKFDHGLADLLYRWRIGELRMDLVGIVSNHPRETYAHLDLDGVPFHHLPVTPATRPQQEARIKAVIEETSTEQIGRAHV